VTIFTHKNFAILLLLRLSYFVTLSVRDSSMQQFDLPTVIDSAYVLVSAVSQTPITSVVYFLRAALDI